MTNDPLFSTYASIAVVLAAVFIYGLSRVIRRALPETKPEEPVVSPSTPPVPSSAPQQQAQQRLEQEAAVAAYYNAVAAQQRNGMIDGPVIERCICGRPATARAPRIERGRGAYDWLREMFALPPHYKRVVPLTGPLTLCDSHSHVADSLVEEFIHVRVRGLLTKTYREIATEAAGFEQEILGKQLAESLTDEQKRERKREQRSASVVAFPPPRTGSDE